MKFLIPLAGVLLAWAALQLFSSASPEEWNQIQKRLAAHEVVIVDVREPAEWQSGVIDGALLLPLSDLQGGRSLWDPALEEHRGKEWLVYCRSGNRASGVVAQLQKEGLRASNIGGFSSWKSAGAPTKTP